MTENEDFLSNNLARWFEPVLVEEPPERFDAWRAVSTALEGDLNGRVLEATLAAHGELTPETAQWVGDHIRATNESLVYEGKDELQRRLVAVALMRHIALTDDDSAVLASLATLSAQFAGLTPILAEFPQLSAARLDEIAQQKRSRGDGGGQSVAESIGSLPRTRKPDEDTGAVPDVTQVAADLGAHVRAIKSVAAAADSALQTARRHQAALDEEIEMLWWVIKNRDSDGLPWGDQPPVVRAVNGANELAERTLRLPGPPSADALLKRIVAPSNADEEATIAVVVEQIAYQDVRAKTAPRTPLLPLLGSTEIFRELRVGYDDDDTWQKVVSKQLGVDTQRSSPLASVSEQLYRELQMLRILGE